MYFALLYTLKYLTMFGDNWINLLRLIGKNKDEIIESFKKEMENEKLEEEVFEVTKNNVKSTFKYLFNKQGYPVHAECISELIIDNKENLIVSLQRELEEAVKAENYSKAADLQKRIRELRPTDETN